MHASSFFLLSASPHEIYSRRTGGKREHAKLQPGAEGNPSIHYSAATQSASRHDGGAKIWQCISVMFVLNFPSSVCPCWSPSVCVSPNTSRLLAALVAETAKATPGICAPTAHNTTPKRQEKVLAKVRRTTPATTQIRASSDELRRAMSVNVRVLGSPHPQAAAGTASAHARKLTPPGERHIRRRSTQ